MTVYLLIAIPLAAGIVGWAVGFNPRTWFAGTGKRRFTVQSAKEAAETIRTLEMQLAEANRRTCRNCGEHPNSGMPSRQEIAASDAHDTTRTINAPAPVDNGSRDTPLANAETQPVDVRDLREALGESDTVTLPAVAPVTPVVPLHDAPLKVTWGVKPTDKTTTAVEDVLNIPAPDPLHSATAVPKGIGNLAHDKVEAALVEAALSEAS